MEEKAKKEVYIEMLKSVAEDYKKDKRPGSSEVIAAYKNGYYLGFFHGIVKACAKDNSISASDMLDIMLMESKLYAEYFNE